MSTKQEIIYIPLLNEGVPVLRPTLGKKIKKDIFKVLPTKDYDPEDEHWEYLSGSLVKCEKQFREKKEILVAVRAYIQAA